ncbi:MAG: hypothetical protein LC739_04090 [Actinobacteria bacterium]|nr:hypothetical protein [Actinomycetota bacterium]
MKALTKILIAALAVLAACSSGTTPLNADDMAELGNLQTQLTQFASEVETAAPAAVQNAWDDLETAFNGLLSSGSDLELTADDLTPLREAADAVTEAVQTDGADLSDEFRDFWTNFSSRVEALTR